jgi:hypothetical protein
MEATLVDYFKRPDTPEAGSPVGRLIVQILARHAAATPEDAREKANALLDRSARRFRYTLPRALSPEETALRRKQLLSWFQTAKRAA